MDADDWQHLIFALLGLAVLTTASVILTHVGQAANQRLVPEATGQESRIGRTTGSVLNTRRRIAGASLFVQMLATVIAGAQITALVDNLTEGEFGPLAVLITAIVYIVFGLALPRAIADKTVSDSLLDRVFALGRALASIAAPVLWLVEKLGLLFRKILPGEDADSSIVGNEDEFRLLGASHDDGLIGETERQMIDGILSLEEMTVRDIMVPRLDIIGVERRVSSQELIDTIIKAGHSRIPVYRESIDNVLGVLYVKDLLPFVIGNTIRIPLLDLIRPAFVVPESKRLPDLFTELKRTKTHLAIVADEYGGTAGLITIEDILEEIVGEIQDEYDSEQPLFEQEEPGVLIADGRLPIEDVEEALDVEFEDDEDFGTLGGFVHKHLGRLAVKGDTFEAEGVRVEILEIERHRVRAMRISRLPEPEEEPDERRDRRRSRGGQETTADEGNGGR
ncbi:MAG TPA: hemolysin family protein [Thermomicrobiales bacterium]|nr:hemolysin family protein [Thermomicrobiales bacterium]